MAVPDSRKLPRISLAIERNSRHPWVYRKMCRPATVPPGSLVEVWDRSGRLVGRGIYNRKSQIAVRLLTEDPEQPLDAPFLEGVLDRAVAFRRETLKLEAVTDAYRAVHAEGDGLSGLIVDRLGDFVVVELFSAGWYRLLRWLLPALSERFPGTKVLVRADALTERREGFHVRDFVAERLGEEGLRATVREHGIRYEVDLRHGHKTGFFCDQRENRLRVRDLARGRRVLDGCCYSGGFALHAARGGALSVDAVDLDEKALAVARANVSRNRVPVALHHADLFQFLRAAREAARSFDLVVLDPPKFAAGRTEVDRALRRYRDLNELALGVLAPAGTLVTCSCSGAVSESRFADAVLQGARRARRQVKILRTDGAAQDHPVRPEFPEGRYLKVLTLRVS